MRTKKEIITEYHRWVKEATQLSAELSSQSSATIEDAFYRNLAFGTGGLRGIIGAGTNRINIYTVGKASQGLANYIHRHFNNPSVAIAYDSRIKSDLFSQTAASVFAANNIKVYLYKELMPTPCLSYAVRALKCSAGIVITASHNPSEYNGYKVYGNDGCQITTEAADAILNEIESVDIFEDVKTMPFDKAIGNASIEYIPDYIYDEFTQEVINQSVLFGDEIDKNVSIVYSPLNGTGLMPVMRVLEESGFTNITVVEEQKKPDGNFQTCPYPNPEIKEAMDLGLQYCKRADADLLLATDPDADRCGIAVRTSSGNYQLLSGNEVGLLLLDYICAQRLAHNMMPHNPVFIKTIVTMDLAENIAEHYGVETINVLTGFKYIGEQIGKLEEAGREADYICGFEESYGYLTGSYVRDKDAINAVFIICEMFAFYKTRGISLLEKLKEIYSTYGYCLNSLYSYEFDGPTGMQKMNDIMATFREGLDSLDGQTITETLDYNTSINSLPKSNVIKYIFGSGSVVIRPSGTEPKLKTYISVTAADNNKAKEKEQKIIKELEDRILCE